MGDEKRIIFRRKKAEDRLPKSIPEGTIVPLKIGKGGELKPILPAKSLQRSREVRILRMFRDKDLEEKGTGKVIAEVSGKKQNHIVTVKVDNKKIVFVGCDCPHFAYRGLFASGEDKVILCKHLARVIKNNQFLGSRDITVLQPLSVIIEKKREERAKEVNLRDTQMYFQPRGENTDFIIRSYVVGRSHLYNPFILGTIQKDGRIFIKYAYCNCPDFAFRGAESKEVKFCKHLIALFKKIDEETRSIALEEKAGKISIER